MTAVAAVSAGDALLAASRRELFAGDRDAAQKLCDVLLSADPSNAAAWHQRALIALEAGQLDAAEAALQQGLRVSGDQGYCLLGLVDLHLRRGALEQARETVHRALQAQPELAGFVARCGHALLVDERLADAEVMLREALASQSGPAPDRADPALGDILFDLAVCLHRLGQTDEAESLYRRVIHLAPAFPIAYNNLANLLRERGLLHEAEHCYRRAIALGPDEANSYNNLACTVLEQGRGKEALALYEQALTLAPTDAHLQSNRLLAMHYVPGVSRQALWEAHRQWGAGLLAAQSARQPSPLDWTPGQRPLRVGFVSGDLFQHPVGIFLLPLIQSLERGRVTPIAYQTLTAADAMTERLRAAFAHWRSLAALDDEAAAALIERDRIDILFDLSGHTPGHRLALFARRPAPLSVTWLGYPDTTGLSQIDYRLTDAVADPPGSEVFHTERLLRMDGGCHCFQPPLPPALSPPAPALRSRLAAGQPTFGCMNNLAKFSDPFIALLAALLHRLPEARLLLKNSALGNPEGQAALLARFTRWEIAAERLELIGRVHDYAEHLRVYQRVDIALDTYPYNGTTTTCEALYMGVPVVTLAGDHCCSRMGASLLARVGLDDLVASTPEQLIEIAAGLAADVDRIKRLRASLRGTLDAVPLGSPSAFARAFEAMLDEAAASLAGGVVWTAV